MKQAPADTPQTASEPIEPFALARRGLPLITRNAEPLRAPWLPPQLCSRAQTVPVRLLPVAPPEQEADDPHWLQPMGRALGAAEIAAAAQADEPWWMEAAEWIPGGQNEAAPLAASEAQAVDKPAFETSAPVVKETLKEIEVTSATQARSTAVPEARAPRITKDTLGLAPEPRNVEVVQRHEVILAAPQPQAALDAAAVGAAPVASKPADIHVDVSPMRSATASERVIERTVLQTLATDHPAQPAPRATTRVQDAAASTARPQAEIATVMQKMGSAPHPAMPAAAPSMTAPTDTRSALARIAAVTQAQAADSAPRVHIDHVAVTVAAPAAPISAPAQAPTAPLAPAAAPPTQAAPARAYASAWSTYFARAD